MEHVFILQTPVPCPSSKSNLRYWQKKEKVEDFTPCYGLLPDRDTMPSEASRTGR